MKSIDPKLKMLFVLPSFTLGGTETHLLRLIDGLKEKGYDISAWFLYERHDILERLKARGVNYGFLKMKNILDIRGAFRLFRLLKKEKFDIVHAYLFDPSIYVPPVARLAGVKVVLTSRRNYDDWMRPHHIIAQRFANLFTDKILTNSETVREFVIRRERVKKDRVSCIYNSIEKDKFYNRIPGVGKTIKSQTGQQLGLQQDDLVVTMVAKFKKSKGHEFLLNAAKKVIESFPRVKFILVGGHGPTQISARKRVKDLGISNNVIFAGESYNVVDILSMSDICVLSSIREGFSNALMEYMAAGKAVVVTDAGGNGEIVANGKSGILVPKEDAEALAGGIIDLLKDGRKRAQLGMQARERIEDITFEPEYMVDSFNAVYRELLNVNEAKGNIIRRLKRRLSFLPHLLKNMMTAPGSAAAVKEDSPEKQPVYVSGRSGGKKPNIILISIDPLRQDHMSLYGYKRITTPNIDEFAKKCAVFTRAYSQAPWTTPSHMSIFTSLYPSFHGVDQPMGDVMRRLGDDKKTMTEYLKERGYKTAAFTGGGSIAGRWGFSKGFDLYDETVSDEVFPRGHDISVIYDKATGWIRKNKTEDFFLFFHTYNTHDPYNDRYFVETERIPRHKKDERRIALYDGDIRVTDRFFGDLISFLDGEGLLKNTVIVLLSDHGEDFGEHYPFEMTSGHGHSLYEEILRVPIVIYDPVLTEKGLRIDKNVRLIDVMPTVMDMLGIPVPGSIQGKSLVPLIKGSDAGIPEYFFAEAICHGPERKMVSNGVYKYIYSPEPNAQKTKRKIYPVRMYELYDIRKDPQERDNIYEKEKEIARSMHEKLLEFMKKAETGQATAEESEFRLDEKLKARLQALGYIE